MANENTPNNNLSESIAAIEKCIDSMLSEQRKAAHSAIDMDDWSKTEEIIAATKKNIVRIESLKSKFEEFKAEAVKLEFISADNAASPSKPVEQPKPEPKPVEQPKPEPKPVEQPKPEPKPVEQPKPEPKPVEQPKPEPKPVEQPKPEPKPVEQPKPEPKPVEQPKPEPKPVEQPKPEPKPVEQPKPEPKPVEQPKPEPKPVEQPKPSPMAAQSGTHDRVMEDFDMGAGPVEDTRAAKLIVDACEKLITKFPFSMRLIYSNSKIGTFFTADQVIADNDMKKPKQLSNGLWVETNVPDEKIQAFIRSVTRYCEDSVNM